jgi:hypothetical protein
MRVLRLCCACFHFLIPMHFPLLCLVPLFARTVDFLLLGLHTAGAGCVKSGGGAQVRFGKTERLTLDLGAQIWTGTGQIETVDKFRYLGLLWKQKNRRWKKGDGHVAGEMEF